MPDTKPYPNQTILVESAWLADHISDTDLRIIDVRSQEEYDKGHIPGAINLLDIPFNLELVDPDDFAQTLSKNGIGNDSRVICYDDLGPPAARAWWLLSYYGLMKVHFLNGGLKKWTVEKRDLETRQSEFPSTQFIKQIIPDLYCDLGHAKDGVNNSQVIFWDTRLEGEFTGEISRGNAPDRVGRIPGAIHLEWNSVVEPESQTMKPADEIQKILEERGITPESEVLTY
jgi:thiosulfate/3-mercaptopyruvate sulfurtransferase